MKRQILLLLSIILVNQLYSQPAPGIDKETTSPYAPKKGSVSGVITEDNSKAPLEYSNVAIYSSRDSSLIGGGIANADGKFLIENLNYGNYYLEAKFIGYDKKIISNIRVTREKTEIDLGVIELNLATENLGEVKVVGNDKAITYQIDRKVVDPSQFPTAADGTAVDILAQTPSVSVDIEGNVSLRGSQSFTVLIDGRPTPFDPADILEQIPASTIQSIEIITNPSAKYDPDGTAGIINIKTKKSKLEGLSGIVNATGDSYGSLTGDFLLNYKTGKFNFYISGDRANRFSKNKDAAESTIITDYTTNTSSTGESERGRSSYSLKTGFDYYMDDKNTFVFNVGLNGRSRTSDSESKYFESNSLGDEISSVTLEEAERKSTDVAFAMNYYRTFNKEGHKLDILTFYSHGDEDENNFYDQLDFNNSLIEGQHSWEVGDEKEFRFQADYVLPIGDDSKFEAGYQTRIDREDEWNDIFWYTEKTQTPEPDKSSPNYYETYFKRDIHSIYSIWNEKMGIFGYQLGLRTEYTNRKMDYSATTETYSLNRWDIFPTVHMSVEMPAKQQMIASYSRRINRPRGYYLEPFLTYTDAYNVRTGNPSIKPEYIDSYELGYQKQMGEKGFFSAEGYYRVTHDVIERINTAFEENILLRTVDNVGTDYSLGIESMINTNMAKWWILNLMGNLYNYRIEGEAAGKTFDTESTNWNARLNNTFIFTPSTKLQLSGMYNSPTTTAQGRREGFAFTNLALRQDLFNNKLAATFSVRDVLQTAKFEFTSEGVDFYSYRKHEHQAPVYSLTLSFKINNFKKDQNLKNNGSENEMDFEGGEI